MPENDPPKRPDPASDEPGAAARPVADEGPPPGELPATRDELKLLRRWVLVAGVWAVAATAVALIALLDTREEDARKRADAASEKAADVESRHDRRLDALTKRVEELDAKSTDVSRLESRLSKAEDQAGKAADRADELGTTLDDLEERIGTLEDESDAGGAGGDGTDPLDGLDNP